ncbi:MAG TPA: hypothetical protein VFI00_13925, partial [Kribbella sp.]|nr:hypothetical protein [Kribbella sp.]
GEQAQVQPPPVQPTHQPGERRLSAVADIDLSLAPDHGADSYEAGFEDTISLSRRNHPVSRDAEHPAARESERGPRRVHSVPNPDDEPTLIDVPVDQPPALRPAVRAVERPSQPPAEFAPAEERAAAFTDRRSTPDRGPSPVRQAPESRGPADRPASESRADREAPESLASETRQRTSSTPATDPTTRPTPADRRSASPAEPSVEPAADPSTLQPAVEALAASTDPAANEENAAEPKKKPARRGSKRASVPSWDEIMFGKKAD